MTNPTSLTLAMQYMHLVYESHDIEGLNAILDPILEFEGPLFKFNTSQAYIDSLLESPPADFSYELIHSFEDPASQTACLIYQIIKPGVNTRMSQTFTINQAGLISKILLIFDRVYFH